MPDVYQIAGYGGVVFYIGSYGCLQMGLVRGSSYTYAILNMIAAALVLVSLMRDWNMFSAVIQIAWISLSVAGIVRVWLLTHMLRFSDEERALIDTRFANMRKIDAKKLLRAGAWVDGHPGDALTCQGRAVTQLSYIATGGVDIDVGGQVIAQVGAGEFIGEMACMDSGPASASVRLNQPTRYFAVTSEALRGLVRRNSDVRAHLDLAFSGNTRSKLVATNTLLEQSIKARNVVPAHDEAFPK